MKFDLDTAWKDATGLLRRNAGLLAVIAGVFFFLPYAAITMALPEMEALGQAEASGNADAMMAAVTELYTSYWWAFLILTVVQGIGLLAMLALVRRRANPTVGEALATGARSVASYIGAQLLQTAALVLIAVLLIGGFGLGGRSLAFLGALIAIAGIAYLLIKLSLVAPVIAIEGELNPVRALARSWVLTSGNSLRLFVFYLLLGLAFLVVSAVLSLVLGLGFALGGEQVALLGNAIVSALTNAAAIVLMVCILAAVHTQLTRLGERAADRAEG